MTANHHKKSPLSKKRREKIQRIQQHFLVHLQFFTRPFIRQFLILKIFVLLICSFLLSISVFYTTHLYAQNQFRAGFTELSSHIKVEKLHFFLGEPILIDFRVQNQSSSSVILKVSEKAYYNFLFSVFSIENQKMEEKDSFYFEKLANSSNTFIEKEIRLAQNEFYGEVFDLRKFFELSKPGTYVVQGFFTQAPSNLRPVQQIRTQQIQIHIENLAELRTKRIIRDREFDNSATQLTNPYETVEYALKARTEKNWNSYFSTLDLKRLIVQYPEFYREYQDKKPSQRTEILKEFQEFLKGYLDEIGLGTIEGFEVFRSVIDNDRKEAQISVRIRYRDAEISFHRRYVFSLYEKGTRWYIYSWKVQNI